MRTWNSVAIVGVGLIGSSIGLGLRERKLARRVVGIGHRQSTLDEALRVGAIDAATTDLARGVAECELIVLCTPVDQIVPLAQQAAQHCPEGALITDAGSTKARIVEGLAGGLPRGVRFLGSHPLAGSERRGPAEGRANLYADRVVVLTPTDESLPADRATLRDFWTSLGARVVELPPAEHDLALASTSHLPHLIAAALAAAVPERYFALAATGLADTTRIAAGDPALWRQIFLANREHLLAALATFEEELTRLRQAIDVNDAELIENLLAQAKRNRDALGS